MNTHFETGDITNNYSDKIPKMPDVKSRITAYHGSYRVRRDYICTYDQDIDLYDINLVYKMSSAYARATKIDRSFFFGVNLLIIIICTRDFVVFERIEDDYELSITIIDDVKLYYI